MSWVDPVAALEGIVVVVVVVVVVVEIVGPRGCGSGAVSDQCARFPGGCDGPNIEEGVCRPRPH